MQAIDKMKEFITNFANSPDTQKEVKSLENIKKWLTGFKLESIPKEAIDELVTMIEIAEDKSKIALIDLVRLLMQYEPSAAHFLNKHWQSFEVNIFGYVQCLDIKDSDARIMQNYHLVCLKMLSNMYLTESGKDFMQGQDASRILIDFCTFSLDSVNPKVVFHAAVLLFNQVLCFKREKSLINEDLYLSVQKIA